LKFFFPEYRFAQLLTELPAHLNIVQFLLHSSLFYLVLSTKLIAPWAASNCLEQKQKPFIAKNNRSI